MPTMPHMAAVRGARARPRENAPAAVASARQDRCAHATFVGHARATQRRGIRARSLLSKKGPRSEPCMISVCLLVLTGAAAFAFYTYVGYPLLLMGLAVVRRRRSPVVPLAEWPRVTVVLPVHNEEAVIRGTFENLLELDHPPDRRHILVVSDASTDRTDSIVKE